MHDERHHARFLQHRQLGHFVRRTVLTMGLAELTLDNEALQLTQCVLNSALRYLGVNQYVLPSDRVQRKKR